MFHNTIPPFENYIKYIGRIKFSYLDKSRPFRPQVTTEIIEVCSYSMFEQAKGFIKKVDKSNYPLSAFEDYEDLKILKIYIVKKTVKEEEVWGEK